MLLYAYSLKLLSVRSPLRMPAKSGQHTDTIDRQVSIPQSHIQDVVWIDRCPDIVTASKTLYP